MMTTMMMKGMILMTSKLLTQTVKRIKQEMKAVLFDSKMLLNNQSGIAIMMVLTAVVLLSTIMINFTYDSNVNKIKAYNIENKGQAKLTAESGLIFAMARLKLYKEAFNYLENNKSAKDFATPEVLNSIWNFPFVYPIPVNAKMNAIQKDSIQKFSESNFMRGSLKLTINNLSQRINLNMLRVSLIAEAVKASEEIDTNDTDSNDEEDNDFNVENQLVNTFKFSIERKSQSDDLFASKYLGIDPVNLVNTLKVYLSDPETLQDDGGASILFDREEIQIKRAPLSSSAEIYNLPGWDDELIDLIKGEFTVYGALMIDLNKITDKMLRILIPSITDEEVKEFFEYRDDPETPQFFNKTDDFKNYIVNIGNVLTEADFDERMAKFEKQGLKFGPTPSLFKVISTGSKDRANYTITAYVSIPARPALRPQTNEDEDENDLDNPINPNDPNDPNNTTTGTNTGTANTAETEQPTQLLEPRILEIFIN